MLSSSLFIFVAVVSQDECFARFSERAPRSGRVYFHRFDDVFSEVGAIRNVDPHLIKAVAWCETRLDPCSVSPAGARGLLQFIPTTFADVAGAANASDAFVPEESVRAGGVYLAALLNHWRGEYVAVIASYNAGPEAVARARRKGRIVPAIVETEEYVGCVLRALSDLGGAVPPPPPATVAPGLLGWLLGPLAGFSSP